MIVNIIDYRWCVTQSSRGEVGHERWLPVRIMIDMVSQAITSEATTQRTGENETRPPLEPRGFRSLDPRGFRMPGVDDVDSPDDRGVRRPLPPLPPPPPVAGGSPTSACSCSSGGSTPA
eukprot:SAG25_NODE_1157_length_3752_cov_1.837394_2_plen_119_part_00